VSIQPIDIIDLQNKIRLLLSQRDRSVLALIEQHRSLAEENDDQEHIGESHVNFALYYSLIEINYEKFTHYTEQAKKHFDLSDNRKAAYFYGNIAFCYQTHSKLPESQGYFLRAINCMEQLTDMSVAEIKRLASHYYNLYILFGFSDLGTLEKRYIDRALELNMSVDNKLGMSYCYSAIVGEYDRQGKIAEALDYALRRVKTVEELKDTYQLGLAYSGAGLMYAKLADPPHAFEYFDKAKSILFPTSPAQFQAGYHQELAETYLVFKQYEEAIDNFHKSITLYESIGSALNLSKIYRLLATAYKGLNDPAQALLYQEKYSQSLLDSFQLDKLLAATAIQHEYEQKQQEIETALLKQKNEEISMYVKQLEQSNDDLKQFAHAASHDLREPVRTIVSYANLLELSLKDKLNQEEKEYITYLKDGGRRINEMITGILAFSKVTNAQEVTEIDLNDIYLQVVENIKLSITAKKALIEHPQLPVVMGNSTLLIQLFQNLISNGIKYNESAVPMIKISYTLTESNMYLFCIADNGIGIEEKYKDEVFDIFTRLHNRELYQGTGIGLSICKKIVERMGGEIWNQPNALGGTDFLFTLPASF
jgi:signal transduction histidine kinase